MKHKLYQTYFDLLNEELPSFEKICDMKTAEAFLDHQMGVFGFRFYNKIKGFRKPFESN